MLYAACMSYGDKLSGIIKSIPNEGENIIDRLSDRAKKQLEPCKENHRVYGGINHEKWI